LTLPDGACQWDDDVDCDYTLDVDVLLLTGPPEALAVVPLTWAAEASPAVDHAVPHDAFGPIDPAFPIVFGALTGLSLGVQRVGARRLGRYLRQLGVRVEAVHPGAEARVPFVVDASNRGVIAYPFGLEVEVEGALVQVAGPGGRERVGTALVLARGAEEASEALSSAGSA
jgi:hypothetical protein